jgi:hypothetical protein
MSFDVVFAFRLILSRWRFGRGGDESVPVPVLSLPVAPQPAPMPAVLTFPRLARDRRFVEGGVFVASGGAGMRDDRDSQAARVMSMPRTLAASTPIKSRPSPPRTRMAAQRFHLSPEMRQEVEEAMREFGHNG